jgi:hypothetical protein
MEKGGRERRRGENTDHIKCVTHRLGFSVLSRGKTQTKKQRGEGERIQTDTVHV